MNKRILIGAVGASLMAGSLSAHAQIYGDLRGQTASFTGTLNAAGSVSANTFFGTVFSTSFNETLILENPPLGTNGNGITYTDPISIPFPNTGPATDSMLTGTYPLPSINVGGQMINLPTLSLTGSYNRNTGDFNFYASAPTTTINTTIDGISISVTISNPNIDFVGDTITAPGASPLILQGTQNAVLNVGLSGSALGGLASLDFSGVDIYFSQYDFTFPDGSVPTAGGTPEPSALAMLATGTLGSLLSLRRRKKN